jgi:MFS family permease
MMTQTMREIFTRDFILAFLAHFTFVIAFHALTPTLPIYLSRLGSKETEIGVLVGIFFVSSLVSRPFVGKALLRIPERTFMITGALLFAVTSVTYLWAPPFWPFFIVRAFQGMSLGVIHTAVYTLIANISPEARRGQSLSYFFVAPTVALALAPPFGIFLINHFSFTFLFLVCSGMSLCSLLFSSQLGRKQVSSLRNVSTKEGLFISWKALAPCISIFLAQVIWGALIAFFPLYAISLGVANPGLFFTAIAIMIISGRVFGGKILDLYSKQRVILSFLITHVISMSLLFFSKSLPMFILVGAIWGVGSAFVFPAGMAYTLDRAGSPLGPAIATFTAMSDLGVALGPVIMGIIIRVTSYPTMFLCLVLTSFINFNYFYFFVRQRR